MEAFVQEIARQKHEDLLGVAERYRLARIVQGSNKTPVTERAPAENKPSLGKTAAVSGRAMR